MINILTCSDSFFIVEQNKLRKSDFEKGLVRTKRFTLQ